MGLIERIKSALGLGSSAPPSQPGTTAGNRPSPADDAGTSSEPEPATEVQHDDELASAQTVVESPGATEDDGVDVTVEHDPDDGATADAAGSGSETAAAAETETAAEPEAAAEPDTADAEEGETEPSSTEPADSGTDAPDTEAEDAVKGTDTADGGTDADLEDIKGIGPTYADRLRDAGVESVDALATADAAEVGDATGIGESRVQKWIDRAETY